MIGSSGDDPLAPAGPTRRGHDRRQPHDPSPRRSGLFSKAWRGGRVQVPQVLPQDFARSNRRSRPCPLRRRIARAQRAWTAGMLWLTKRTVRPCSATSPILPRHFFWNVGVADREHLVDEQDLRLEVRRHGEGQPHVHAARVALDRRVEELLDLGERDDLVELAVDLGPAHAEDRAVEVDVLAAGQLGMKAGADLEQRCRRGRGSPRSPSRRLGDAREDLQQRALARAVAADDARRPRPAHVEA